MPHMTVEYTSNLQGIDEAALLTALTNAVCDHPSIAEEADVKTRISALNSYQIGRNNTGRGFVHVELRWMAGRSAEVKKEVSDSLAATLKAKIPAQPGLDVQLSVNIVDMDKPSYFKGKL